MIVKGDYWILIVMFGDSHLVNMMFLGLEQVTGNCLELWDRLLKSWLGLIIG